MRWEAFLDHVQERGEYATPQEAERAARTVLALLGAHLVGEVRAELAARLPETFAVILLNPLQATEPLPPERFLRATAAWIEGATEQTVAWDVSAVLSVTADAAGEELTRRILLQLPPGYDLLFGRPERAWAQERVTRSSIQQGRPAPTPAGSSHRRQRPCARKATTPDASAA